jgi:chromosome segregation ATPase
MSAKRDAYVAKMKTQLDDLNTNIDQLEAKANAAAADAKAKAQTATASAEAKTKAAATDAQAKGKTLKTAASASYTQTVSKLRDQSNTAAAKLDELKATGDAAWDTKVAEMDKVHAAFTDAVADFKSKV